MKQEDGSIETYYNELQGSWREINFHYPKLMEFESNMQEDRVYTFIDGLNDRLDKVWSDVLQINPFPMVAQAYALVQRKDSRQIMMLTRIEVGTNIVMISKG